MSMATKNILNEGIENNLSLNQSKGHINDFAQDVNIILVVRVWYFTNPTTIQT